MKVDRSSIYGNPFQVGPQGPAVLCVYNYAMMIHGLLCIAFGEECFDRQAKALAVLKAQKPDYAPLRGKNLACWCRPDQPCHADILLFLVNSAEDEPLDFDGYLARFGWRVQEGEPIRLSS